MSDWNGRLIEDLSLQHIENTMAMLEQRAKQACSKARGSDWRLYVSAKYFELEAECEKRNRLCAL